MNHIQKLTAENKALKETIVNLEKYLTLPKFNFPQNNVNTNDIFLRLDEGKNNMLEAGLTPWGDWVQA